MTRKINLGIAGLVVMMVAAGLGGFLWLRTSLPQASGSVTLAGLNRPVEVVRDANAVPHIFAENQEDAYFALGYVHAQDRLWQMELTRRLGAGRLAEVLGEQAVSSDRFVRTLGLYRLAEASVEPLSPPVRAAVTRTLFSGDNSTREAEVSRPTVPPAMMARTGTRSVRESLMVASLDPR